MSGDRVTKALLFISSLTILLLSAGIVISLLGGALPAFKEFGVRFITSSVWNPTEGSEEYGAMAFIAGTVITSILALIICIPMAFSTSLFIAEY
ncbi:MAG TPA: phosphate ABC transporter permease subunit PstC, partial [Bacteroidales bacterium]|nr:phosphate ABC transporter permease subunit PstC [Bacteroidales bacterium]